MAQAVSEKAGGTARSTKPLRLNLGGAGEGFKESRIPGFMTVDLREGPDTDVVADCSKLDRFENSGVDEIYASNILEHWGHQETVSVLKEWFRVLKRGGKLYVSVPDMEYVARTILNHGYTEWLNFHVFGDQKHELNYHYTGFTFATLAKALSDAGFSDVKRVKEFGLADDGSCNVSSLTNEFISLNVIAIK